MQCGKAQQIPFIYLGAVEVFEGETFLNPKPPQAFIGTLASGNLLRMEIPIQLVWNRA